ncbi:MAG: hypothetical protein ABIT96_06515 [Ferruginibacter sp.]
MQVTQLSKHDKVFLAFVMLLVVHLAFVFTGFYNNDDLNYARYAAGIAQDGILSVKAQNHYQLRWTVIFVSAFFYKIFGINAITSALCSFISVLLSGWLLKKIIHNYPPKVFVLSLVLFFFAHSILFYMQRILPDPAMCLAVLGMYTAYRTYRLKQQNPIRYGLLFSLAFILAIITKETIIIALPLFILFFLADIYYKKYLNFWYYTIAFSLLFVFIYLLFFKITTGEYFYRYYLLQSNNYLSQCSFDKLPFENTLRRVGYELWYAMLLNGDMLILLPALAACFYRKKISQYVMVDRLDVSAFFILLCSANFMTISFSNYVPLCQDPRHFLFLFPFAAIIGGPLLYAYLKEPAKFLLLPVFILIATGIIFYLQAGSTKYLYLLFFLILVARLVLSVLSSKRIIFNLSFLALIALFFINYLADFIKPPYPYYQEHKEIINSHIRNLSRPAILVSPDAFTAEMSEYFLNFKPGKRAIISLDTATKIKGINFYYLVVEDLDPASYIKADSLLKAGSKAKFFLVERKKHVALYEADSLAIMFLKQ